MDLPVASTLSAQPCTVGLPASVELCVRDLFPLQSHFTQFTESSRSILDCDTSRKKYGLGPDVRKC